MQDDSTRLRVLLVEDESVVALDIAHQLESLGYTVIGPVDIGEEAVERGCDADLALMDIRLRGEMDGIEAARLVVERYRIPIIFISAYSDRASVERAKESVPAGYILKPFQERELSIAIELAMYRHNAERELSASRELLNRTVSAITDAVITTDESGIIRLYNHAAAQLLKLTGDATGRRFRDTVRFDDLDEGADRPRRRLLLRSDGSTAPVDVSQSPLQSDSGEVWVIRDASVQHAAENRLIAARRHAEFAARAKGDFLARVTHELRTPLNSIIGMTDLATERCHDPQQRQYLDLVKESGEALNRLIGEILDFSRMEAGELAVEETTFELSQLLADAASEQIAAATEKGLAIYLNARPSAHREVRADRNRFSQILVAVIGNAVKFTERGEIRVTAECVDDQDGSTRLIATVSDTGPGIPESTKNDMLEPFSQGEDVLTRDAGGFGMGLAIVQRMTKLFGGSFEIESTVDVGTTARITLPCATVRSAALAGDDGRTVRIHSGSDWFRRVVTDYATRLGMRVVGSRVEADLALVDGQNPGASEDGATVEMVSVDGPVTAATLKQTVRGTERDHGPSISGLHALLVEDNRVNRMLGRRLLEQEGCTVTEAESGREALDLLDSGHFDFVLLDIEMPGIDGYETARLIRQGGYGDAAIPILSVTGHDARQELEKVKCAGIDGQLAKPFRADDVAQLLAKAVPPGGGHHSLDTFIADATEALSTEDYNRLSDLCKAARADLAGDARTAELVFRIQLAGRKRTKDHAQRLIAALETVSGKKN